MEVVLQSDGRKMDFGRLRAAAAYLFVLSHNLHVMGQWRRQMAIHDVLAAVSDVGNDRLTNASAVHPVAPLVVQVPS